MSQFFKLYFLEINIITIQSTSHVSSWFGYFSNDLVIRVFKSYNYEHT